MTKAELETLVETLVAENKKLKQLIAAEEEGEFFDPDDVAEANMIAEAKLAEAERKCYAQLHDPADIYEQRCIDWLESQYDYEYGW